MNPQNVRPKSKRSNITLAELRNIGQSIGCEKFKIVSDALLPSNKETVAKLESLAQIGKRTKRRSPNQLRRNYIEQLNIKSMDGGNSYSVPSVAVAQYNLFNATRLLNLHHGFYFDSVYNELLYIPKEGDPIALMNAELKVLRCIKKYTSAHTYDKWIELCVRNNRSQESFLIKEISYSRCRDRLKDLPWLNITSSNNDVWGKYLSELYASADIQESIEYEGFAGWFNDNGTLRYLHDGLPNVTSVIKLIPNLTKAQRFIDLFMTLMMEPTYLWIILLYSLYSCIQPIYDAKGFTGFRSCLYIIGRTQSGKTSLAKTVVGCLNQKPKDDIVQFDSTMASIEETLVTSMHRPILVDDMFMKVGTMSNRELQEKASNLTRICGDRKFNDKMAGNGKKRANRDYSGGVIGTGEFLALNTYSSYGRTLVVPVSKGMINLDAAMSELSKDNSLANAFFSEFILWSECNQTAIGQFVADEHVQLEQTVKRLDIEPRTKEEYISAQIMARLLQWFSKDSKINIDTTNIYEDIINYFTGLTARLTAVNPVDLFKEALVDALGQDAIQIAKSEEIFHINDIFHGYVTRDILYIETKVIREYVKKYSQSKDIAIIYDTVLSDLESEHLLFHRDVRYTKDRFLGTTKDPSRHGDKTEKARTPKRPHLLKLSINVLPAEMQEEFKGDYI